MNKEMAETLVRTGPGTPMGNLMRRYWVPILLASEVAEPDGPPVRAHILGEKLIAFRNSDGVPSAPQACKHMGIKAYPCIERAGMVWAYMGPKGKEPASPAVEWCNLP